MDQLSLSFLPPPFAVSRILELMSTIASSREGLIRQRPPFARASCVLPLLLLLALPLAVQAQFDYTTNNGTITITGYTGPGGDVTIPSTINGLLVTSIGEYAFDHCTSIASVTIPNSVTRIGYRAFAYCTSLTNVTIPNSITNIGEGAFSSCTSMSAIVVDALNSFYSSLNGVLFNKGQTTLIQYPGGKPGSYTIPNTVSSIGSHAFEFCTGLTSVIIPNSVTNIGNSAFFSCPNLTSVTIGNSVTSIGDYTFFSCTRLTSVTIPNGVTIIGRYTFYYCTSLTNITIGRGVTSIADDTFYTCTSLSAITMDALNPVYSSVAGVLFNKNQTTLVQCPRGKAGTYAIPNSVASIGSHAFDSCTRLTNVTIPSSVNTIGAFAFSECASLASVTIGNSVTSIGDHTFHYCTNLTSVTIPNSATNIGYGAFYYCTSLTNVTIPNSVTKIGGLAFDGCSSPTNVTIGNSVTTIGDFAFAQCTSLTNITIPNSVTNIGNGVFGLCTSLASITIPDSVTSIGDWAFDSCTKLASITIPNSVTSIGSRAFFSCTSLTNVTIGSSVTSIGSLAFDSCASLTAITVAPLNPFYSSVAGVLFNKSQTTLVEFPRGIAAGYTIPNSVTTIGSYAFYDCTNLTSVTIGNSVTNIGDCAFSWCTSLAGVYFTGNAPSVGGYVFSEDNRATVYYLAGTSGWTPQVQTSGGSFGVRTNRFGFSISGASGLGTLVEACTNLANPVWSPVGTNYLSSGSFYFSDPQWTDFPRRFYRLQGTSFGGLPTVLWNPQVQASGGTFGVRTNGFGFAITGSSNLVIVVEACVSLANPTWIAVSTNTLTAGTSYFSDPQWTNYPSRFYRLRSP